MQNKPNFVNYILHILGFSLCVIPPAICTLTYFPLWVDRGGSSCLAGGCVLLLTLSLLPLYKRIRAALVHGPSYLMWLVIFVLFHALSRIADEVAVISLVGFIGNLLGAGVLWIARRRAKNEKRGV